MMYYIDKPDEMIKEIVRATFPSYKGRKFKLSTRIPRKLDSYWDGGSIDYYSFYELSTGKQIDVGSNHPFFERGRPRDLFELPLGIIIVKHSIFMGKDSGITIFANESDLANMLPPKVELSKDEKTVLKYTASYKSSYAGIKNYRWHEANRDLGISLEEWEEAKEKLIEKKMLNKRGAITVSGRNAV